MSDASDDPDYQYVEDARAAVHSVDDDELTQAERRNLLAAEDHLSAVDHLMRRRLGEPDTEER